MHYRQGLCLLFSIFEVTRRISAQLFFFEIIHQLRDKLGQGKSESSLADSYLTILSSPFINFTEPIPVHIADISSSELMILIIDFRQLVRGTIKFYGFNFFYFPLIFYVEEIFQHQPF